MRRTGARHYSGTMTPTLSVLADLSLGHVPDADLLLRFVRDGDCAAFELLVRRHWRLVFGVCRRVAGDAHDAEDAAQAAFLVLVRRAEVVRGTHLAPWLVRVAYRCAVRVRTRRRDHSPIDLATVSAPEPVDSDSLLCAVLDAELNRLPAKYRIPVVLCYLQGKTYEQAAAELNCPLGTLSGRLTRAKTLLRTRLVRRGVTMSAGGLMAFLVGLGSGASATDHAVRSITATAASLARGEAIPWRAQVVANGVIQMMTWKSKLVPVLGAVAALLGLAAASASLEPPKPPEPPRIPVLALPTEVKKTDAVALQGVWVFDAARRGKVDALGMVWASRVVIHGDAVSVEPFLDEKLVLRGKIKLDASVEPKRLDLILEELDFAPTGDPFKIAAGTYPGVYKLDGTRLSLCLALEKDGPRPAAIDAPGERVLRATLVKAPAGFKEFPKEVTVKAVGADGKPVSGAVVAGFMNHQPPVVERTPDGRTIPPEKLTDEQRKKLEQLNKVPAGAIRDEGTGWTFTSSKTTAADGTVKIPFEDLPFHSLVVRDPASKRMGLARVSPASLLTDTVVMVKLQPECRVHVTGECKELTKSGLTDVFHAYVETPDGRRFAFNASESGKLEYVLAPGEYALHMYGSSLMGSKRVTFTVPKDRSEYAVEPVTLPPTGFLTLIGKPAPELTDVVAWKGAAVKLADLKGKYVLVEFWGYWCGPCVASMPVLMELHDRFKDKGVVIVGVHVDADGEVDTVRALDDKLALYKKDLWKGRDIPFPVALTSGKRAQDDENAGRGVLATRYGVRGYPSTVLIDAAGKVVGKFHARDVKAAAERLEELLKEAKK
ncbi:sigma-70 family RNA polymerase sigma factor [Frigoriglobus tundricola]|uniref:Thioredoxin domain-containing protein n=1 Tax=Frigoriglobus tundricola TaxID=2774151 RepID=A0A6M5Z4B7_9BACT|nr:sigma-70 family RNA polymerase sigma factor [Frigoriglobus tundricola]QJX00312.1 hypothetical protein FTUN_7938 [Frigoriglobus tundricola]